MDTKTTTGLRSTARRPGARRAAVLGVSALLAGSALGGCARGADEAGDGTTAAPAYVAPLGPVTLPEGASAAVTWTDRIGAVDPQTVNLSGQPLHITVSVACDTEDAEVTIEVVGLMTSGSSWFSSPNTTRTGADGGTTGSMQIAVDQDAEIRVTTVPDDAHWSGAVSTGPRTAPG